MRFSALAAAISAIAAGACAGQPPSSRLASPLATASASASGSSSASGSGAASGSVSDSGARPPRRSDPMPPEVPIRVVSAAGLRVVSAAAPPAAAPSSLPCDDARPGLRAPHRRGADPAPPPLRAPLDLRSLVGRRDARDPLAAVAAWSRELGAPLTATSGAALLSWATEAHRLRPARELPLPGDLLVFDQAVSDEPADLVALVVDRDARGVTELVYLAAGVVRRGLVDASRPSVHRDASGATVNTFLRHGRRWPAPGTRYLAGELLAHVIRMR